MKPEERASQFDLAWNLIKQDDFQKQGQAAQILLRLVHLRDENACGLVGRLLVLKIYSQHLNREPFLRCFYSPIYDPWIKSRNTQSSLAPYTLNDALDYLIIAATANSHFISPLKQLAAFIKHNQHYDDKIVKQLNAIDEMIIPKHFFSAPTVFTLPPTDTKTSKPRTLREEREQCACTLL